MKINNPFTWLKKVGNKILKRADATVIDHLDDCIDLVNDLKRIVNAPLSQAIIKITPTKADNLAVAGLQVVLVEVGEVFSMLDKCKNEESAQLRLKCFIDQLRTFHPDKQNLIYRQIATWLFRDKFKNDLPDRVIEAMVSVRYLEGKEV
jgi:hypothetical protein